MIKKEEGNRISEYKRRLRMNNDRHDDINGTVTEDENRTYDFRELEDGAEQSAQKHEERAERGNGRRSERRADR